MDSVLTWPFLHVCTKGVCQTDVLAVSFVFNCSPASPVLHIHPWWNSTLRWETWYRSRQSLSHTLLLQWLVLGGCDEATVRWGFPEASHIPARAWIRTSMWSDMWTSTGKGRLQGHLGQPAQVTGWRHCWEGCCLQLLHSGPLQERDLAGIRICCLPHLTAMPRLLDKVPGI